MQIETDFFKGNETKRCQKLTYTLAHAAFCTEIRQASQLQNIQ